ncbi:Zinc finger protein [Globisporangium polare]
MNMNSVDMIQPPLSHFAMDQAPDRPVFICPVPTCAKSFSTSGNLSRHKRLHGYIEPLKCPVQGCVCTFPSNNKLSKHMKFHFGSEDVKVCVVVGCGKTFSTTGNLNRHLKTVHDGVAYDSDSDSDATSSSPACASITDSPTSANDWCPDTSMDFELEALWTCAPISFAEPAAAELWGSDLEDVLAVLFDSEDVEVLER